MACTAILFLTASLLGAVGMVLWHLAHFYETNKVLDEKLDFFPSWPDHLRRATSFSLGWSYVLAWVGIGMGFLASALFCAAAVCIR